MYSCGVLHNVDVLSVNTNGSTVGCIYVYPAAGDDISWFYEYGFDNKISKLSSIPAGDLIVTLQYTVDILSCNISVVDLDSVTAKIDFDNVVKAHHKYGISYTDLLHCTIDMLTKDDTVVDCTDDVLESVADNKK